MAPRSLAGPPADGPPFHAGWTVLVGLCCAFAIALTTTTQIYLSMWDHGHSFARLLGWHVSTWLPWALLAPWLMGIGARLGNGSRWTLALTVRTAALGLVLVLVSLLGSTGMMVWLQPYAPVDEEHAKTDNVFTQFYGLLGEARSARGSQ